MREHLIPIRPDEAAQQCDARFCNAEHLAHLQTVVYVMCGGGFLGCFAAEQPADFYIDDRVCRLPYSRKAIYQAVRMLAALAERAGLDPHQLSRDARFHSCGVF